MAGIKPKRRLFLSFQSVENVKATEQARDPRCFYVPTDVLYVSVGAWYVY